MSYVHQLQRLASVYRLFAGDRQGLGGSIATVVAESNSMGDANIDFAERMLGTRITRFVTTNQSKADAIQRLALAIERGEITLLNNETQIAELQALEATRLPSGSFRYAAPGRMHDDTVIALAIAWDHIAAPRQRFTTASFDWYAPSGNGHTPTEQGRSLGEVEAMLTEVAGEGWQGVSTNGQ